MELNEISSIQEHIDHGKDLIISHSTLHLKAKIYDKYNNAIIHCVSPFINKYIDLLSPHIEYVELTQDEYLRFRYQPKTLSLEIYGTTELWSAILAINNMTSITQFNKKTLYLFKSSIMDMLEEILILEEDNIRKNNELIEKDDSKDI